MYKLLISYPLTETFRSHYHRPHITNLSFNVILRVASAEAPFNLDIQPQQTEKMQCRFTFGVLGDKIENQVLTQESAIAILLMVTGKMGQPFLIIMWENV